MAERTVEQQEETCIRSIRCPTRRIRQTSGPERRRDGSRVCFDGREEIGDELAKVGDGKTRQKLLDEAARVQTELKFAPDLLARLAGEHADALELWGYAEIERANRTIEATKSAIRSLHQPSNQEPADVKRANVWVLRQEGVAAEDRRGDVRMEMQRVFGDISGPDWRPQSGARQRYVERFRRWAA